MKSNYNRSGGKMEGENRKIVQRLVATVLPDHVLCAVAWTPLGPIYTYIIITLTINMLKSMKL